MQKRLDCVRSELAAWFAQRKHIALERQLLRLQIASLRHSLYTDPFRKLFNPNQPRVPGGNPDGGQWTRVAGYQNDEEGSQVASEINDPRVLSDATDPILLGEQYAGNGHHYGVQSVYGQEKYSFSSETLKVFKNSTTGPLNDPTSNFFDKMHRLYNEAVEESLDRYLEKNKIQGNQMTPDQARNFLDEIKKSSDPRIRQFNMRLWMREIMFWVRRGPRNLD